MSRPTASTSAINAPPALPSDMKTSNGWPLSSSVIVTYMVPRGDSTRRVEPLSRSGRERLARRCKFSASTSCSPTRASGTSAALPPSIAGASSGGASRAIAPSGSRFAGLFGFVAGDGEQQRVRPQQTSATCTIDLDSSIYEQASTRKQGSDKAYNGEIGYHPLLAFWAEEGELLFSHLRRGSAHTCRNVLWFLRETFKRIPGPMPLALRADSGFYSKDVVQWCEAHHVRFSITADQTAPLLALIEAVPDRCWRLLPDYPLCEVTELRYQPARWSKAYRYVVKRQLAETKAGKLYWQYHVFVTNDEATPTPDLEGWHLQHADMENRIKEHKSGLGLEKLPTGRFHANWAYLLIGQIAFNLLAWFKKLVLPPSYHQATLKTIRHHLLNLAGKIVHSARQGFLVLSNRYRYQAVWQFALGRLTHLKFG